MLQWTGCCRGHDAGFMALRRALALLTQARDCLQLCICAAIMTSRLRT